ncbi:MAG: hypothetical protein ACYDBJ_23730 [Aggregatilineales bacterium]
MNTSKFGRQECRPYNARSLTQDWNAPFIILCLVGQGAACYYCRDFKRST